MTTTAVALAVLADLDDGWGHMGGGWMWVWGFVMIVFWVVVIAAAMWFVVQRATGSGRSGDRARDILAERYARGEISTEEYRERVEELR